MTPGYKNNFSLEHLSQKVDLHYWYDSSKEVIKLDRAIVFARMCLMKVISLELENPSESEQCIPSRAGVHATLQLSKEIKKTTVVYGIILLC